jgi:hypothetical protein
MVAPSRQGFDPRPAHPCVVYNENRVKGHLYLNKNRMNKKWFVSILLIKNISEV